MNKLFLKVGAIVLGAGLVVGSGIAIAAHKDSFSVAKADSTDVITVADTDANSTTYVLTTGIAGDVAVYSSQNAKAAAKDGSGLQYRSNNNNSGIVSTTSGGLIKKVTIAHSSGKSGTLDVYGKNTAYTNPTDLYSDSTKGTLIGSIVNNASLTISDDYAYVGVRSSSGSRYLDSITFEWASVDPTAPTISIDQSGSEEEVGNSGTLTATTTNAGANVVTWSTTDSSVISINSSTGAWEAKKIGAVTITATLGSTGKKASIGMTVTGVLSLQEAINVTSALASGTTTDYKVTTSGEISSIATSYPWYVWLKNGETAQAFEIFFGAQPSNWSDVAIVGKTISAKGNLCNYNGTLEMTNPSNVALVDTDKPIVQDFVDNYMHMTDYDPDLDNTQGNLSCLGPTGYYMTAKAALTALTSTQIALFQSDSDFDNAQARYEAWAAAYGDSTPYATTVGSRLTTALNNNNVALIVIVSSSIAVISAVALVFVLKRKKHN